MNYENSRYDTARLSKKINPKQATKPICKSEQERCSPIISSMHICPITTIVTMANTLVNTIKCDHTTFGLHISMERQMGSFPMSQSTMMLMIGISQCAATILLCNVAAFCALHTFARFDGLGTRYWDCFVPNCTLLSYIVVHFKSTPQLCTLWAYQVTISPPFICHTLLLCDLFIW